MLLLHPLFGYFYFSFLFYYNSFWYSEGNLFLFGGHIGHCFFFWQDFSFFKLFYLKKIFYFVCFEIMSLKGFFVSTCLYYKVLQFWYGVTFGFSKFFRFESRWYRLRVCSIFCVWRLAVSFGTIRFALPINVMFRRFKKRRVKKRRFYLALRSMDPIKSEFYIRLFKDFRFPDMYSKLGVFVNRDEFEWRNTLKRIRY